MFCNVDSKQYLKIQENQKSKQVKVICTKDQKLIFFTQTEILKIIGKLIIFKSLSSNKF